MYCSLSTPSAENLLAKITAGFFKLAQNIQQHAQVCKFNSKFDRQTELQLQFLIYTVEVKERPRKREHVMIDGCRLTVMNNNESITPISIHFLNNSDSGILERLQIFELHGAI